VFYIFEDFGRSSYTLTTDSRFLDWTSAFATSIDESAWFFLLIMFELETYVLEDESWTGWIGNAVRGVRMICFVLIAHTIYAFFVIVLTLQPTVLVEGATSLCDLSDNATAYTYNLEYTEISESNCAALSSDTSFYWVERIRSLPTWLD
jgi:hypothetical protein